MTAIKRVAGKSWRTSAAGWLLLIAAVASALHALLDGNPATSPDLPELIGVLTGSGLISARDNVVSSESAGAK